MRIRPAGRSPEAQKTLDDVMAAKYERLKKQRVAEMLVGRLKRYFDIGRDQIQNAFSCRDCGCLVTDRVQHNAFHARYETKVVIVSEDYDVEREYGLRV